MAAKQWAPMRGVVASVAMLLLGCVAPEPSLWVKDGALNGELELDQYICAQWSQDIERRGQVHAANFQQCMLGQGWNLSAAEVMRNTPASQPVTLP